MKVSVMDSYPDKRTIPPIADLTRSTRKRVKQNVIRPAIWILNAWFWTCMLLGFVIPAGSFHTSEEERIHQEYVHGSTKPPIEEVDKAIQGSFQYTDRIKMLIAFPLALVQYGLYTIVESRRHKHELAESFSRSELA